MRKPIFVSLSACFIAASFVGCGEKSQEAVVSEQLDELLDEMSRLEYAGLPIESNQLEYTLGKEVDGVKVPGSIRFEAAYLDQALALLPMAQEIDANGSPLQKQSANALIGSIRIDEATFLINQAEASFQDGVQRVMALRSHLAILREIEALNNAVAGDGSEVIETYRTGMSQGGFDVIGINTMQEQAGSAADSAEQAKQQLAAAQAKMQELRDKIAEYEALELSLVSQSRTSQSTDKFDKLDQATAAAMQGELAQAEAQRVEIEAWIQQRVLNLADFMRERLDGQPGENPGRLLGKLESFIDQAAEQTNVPSGSDLYTGVTQMLAQAKALPGSDAAKSAAFLQSLSDFVADNAIDTDERLAFASVFNRLVGDEIGVIGALEMKIEQIKLERQRIAGQLAEIESDRQAVLASLASEFDEYDRFTQAAGFARMADAADTLQLAEDAVRKSSNNAAIELMSVYVLHARALQQQHVSAQLYQTALDAMAAAGPELLGDDVHAALTARSSDMQAILDRVATAATDLQSDANTVTASLVNADPESSRGQVSARQIEVFDALMQSISQQ